MRTWGYYTSTRRACLPFPRRENGRSSRRAEIPLRDRARPGRLLVVPLRRIEEPALVRRDAQDHRVHAGEVYRHEGREGVAVRLQAHAQPAVLRRNPQDAPGGPGLLSYFFAAVQRPSCPPSVRNEPYIVAPETRPLKSRRTPRPST